MKELVKKVQVIDDGDIYLGILEKDTILHALKVEHEVENSDLREWLRRINLGDLATVKMRGQLGYSVYDLQPNQKTYLEACLTVMERAKEYMQAWTENNIFNELVKEALG